MILTLNSLVMGGSVVTDDFLVTTTESIVAGELVVT